MGLSIGRMAKRFGLSRSTLLYYDSIGLLTPSGRTPANYRIYSDRDIRRMEQIAVYREAGLPLRSIGEMLGGRRGATVSILEERLARVNGEIQKLRAQQQVIVKLLRNRNALRKSRVMTKKGWVSLLAATGLNDRDMHRWHVEFERMAPEAHQDFLESLGIPKKEIRTIRRWSRERGPSR
jgi:DNA-binding transcriptional MerR regulator